MSQRYVLRPGVHVREQVAPPANDAYQHQMSDAVPDTTPYGAAVVVDKYTSVLGREFVPMAQPPHGFNVPMKPQPPTQRATPPS